MINFSQKPFLFFCFLSLTLIGIGQPTQTIKGTVIDAFTEQQIADVNITLIKDGISIAETITDENGSFKIINVKLGTYDVLFKHLSYLDFISPGIETSISREIVLNVQMKANSKTLTTVDVKANKLRGQAINPMATTSSYSIQADDAKRIAGGLDDPIRIAGTLPGVASSPGFSENFISIRGNSARALKYQIEGLDLPNPTHFSRIGSSGGTFTIFSLQLLDKSDFYTGAFSAQYGNSLGGIFDANLRIGNQEKHEHILQIGVLGIDIASEGPLSKKNKSSYAINYRYGLVGLARAIGYPTQPTYQDISLTLNFPLKANNNLKLFAIGGTSLRDRLGIADSTQWEESLDRTNLILKSSMGTIGGVYKHFLTKKTLLKISAAVSYTDQTDNKEFIKNDYSIINQRTNEYTSTPISIAASIKHKISQRHFHISGISYTNTTHDWQSSRFAFNQNRLLTLYDGSGSSDEIKAYTLSKYFISEKLSVNAGLHYLFYNINDAHSIEPRLSIEYKLNSNHSLSASTGLHSQTENFALYQYHENNISNNLVSNSNLNLAKSIHYVLGYKGKVWVNHRLRIEAYYQDLYDIPVEINGSFSTLNISELQNLRLLNNNGTGQNYGLDLGFERYTDNGLYYIFNTSVYKSLYTSSDNIERSTANDNLYNLKFMIGKEYKLREKGVKYKAFAWNTNLAILGGQPYTPVDLIQSELEQETFYNEELAYSKRDDALVYLDFTFSYKINKKNKRTVWSLQIKNLFSNGNAIYREYDTIKKEEVTVPSSSMFPVISYRLEF